MSEYKDKHPTTGEPGKWKYIGGMGWMNFDESNLKGPRTHYEDGTPVFSYKDINNGRNPNWSIRSNDIHSFVGQGSGSARSMIDPTKHYSGLNDPFWRTSEGRHMMSKWAMGNQSLDDIYQQMARIDSGSRNDIAVQNAYAEQQNLRNGYAPTVAAFERGELNHILDSNGNILPIVGWQVGSQMYNALWQDMGSGLKDRVMSTTGSDANFDTSGNQRSGESVKSNNAPIATTFPTKDMATIVGGPNAGQPTFPNDFDYGAQQGSPGSVAKPLPMEEMAMPRGLFGGLQRGIERSGTWGSGHTQRISGSELQRMAQDAWQSVKPHAESWAQDNPDTYNQLKQTADSFRENPGMFGKTTEDMRNALRVALEKKLLG